VEKKNVPVSILDKVFHIGCPIEEETDLIEAGKYLDAEMRAIRSSGRVLGIERVAIMAALNVTHELLKYKYGKDDYIGNLSSRLKELQDKIDGVLGNDPVFVEAASVEEHEPF